MKIRGTEGHPATQNTATAQLSVTISQLTVPAPVFKRLGLRLVRLVIAPELFSLGQSPPDVINTCPGRPIRGRSGPASRCGGVGPPAPLNDGQLVCDSGPPSPHGIERARRDGLGGGANISSHGPSDACGRLRSDVGVGVVAERWLVEVQADDGRAGFPVTSAVLSICTSVITVLRRGTPGITSTRHLHLTHRGVEHGRHDRFRQSIGRHGAGLLRWTG
jgi:hypothetical protein